MGILGQTGRGFKRIGKGIAEGAKKANKAYSEYQAGAEARKAKEIKRLHQEAKLYKAKASVNRARQTYYGSQPKSDDFFGGGGFDVIGGGYGTPSRPKARKTHRKSKPKKTYKRKSTKSRGKSITIRLG